MIDAGYPFHIGTLEESLKFSAIDEKNETEDIYPAFSLTAKEEGFEDVYEEDDAFDDGDDN